MNSWRNLKGSFCWAGPGLRLLPRPAAAGSIESTCCHAAVRVGEPLSRVSVLAVGNGYVAVMGAYRSPQFYAPRAAAAFRRRHRPGQCARRHFPAKQPVIGNLETSTATTTKPKGHPAKQGAPCAANFSRCHHIRYSGRRARLSRKASEKRVESGADAADEAI